MNKTLLRLGGVLAVYVIITLILTLPASLHVTTRVIGSGGDPWQTMWRFEDRFDAARAAQQHGELGSFIRTEFLGGGEPRLVNLSVWPWMPLHLLFGQPTAYNLIWLLSFMLAGYAMYGLVYYLIGFSEQSISLFRRHAAALIAGIMYMLLPYHVAQARGHFGAMQIHWLPVVMLTALYFFHKPTLWRSILLGIAIIIQAWSEHHYVVWLTAGAVAALAMYWRKIRASVRERWQPWLVLLLLVGTGLVASLWPTIRQATQANSTLALGEDQTIRFSADLFAYVLPASFHSWWGNFFHTLYNQRFTGNIVEATQFLGIVPLLLIVFFYRRIVLPHKKFWAIIAALFAVISLGPRLHLLGYVSPLPLPYAAVQGLPVLSAIRAVARAGVMVGLAASILLGLTLATSVRRGVSFAVVAILIVAEFLFFPVPTQSARVSTAYDIVASLPGDVIIEIPAATNYDLASRALYASRRHGKALLGNIALEREGNAENLARSLPAVRQLLYVRTTDLKEGRQEFFEQNLAETLVDVVKWYDIAAIIIHPDSLSAFQATVLRNFLEGNVGATVIQEDDLVIYPLAALKQKGDGFFAMRGEGWENVGLDKQRNSTFAEIPRRATMTLFNTTAAPILRKITFTYPPESHTGLIANYQGKTVEVKTTDRAASFEVTVAPGMSQLDFINGVPDKAIIQNPTLSTP